MRAQPAKGKLVVVCTEVEKEWRIARLSGIRGVPPEFVTDKVYDNEQDPQHDIFLMRLEEFAETDGFPGALPRRVEAPRRYVDRDLIFSTRKVTRR